MDPKPIVLTPEQERVRDILIETARKKSVVVYSDLVKKAGLKLDMSIPYDRGQLGELLGRFSEKEVAEGRPMLSSVSVLSGSYRCGQGFFDIAKELYGRTFHNQEEKEKFESDEMNDTHEYWSKH
ncbi:MAG: hypothetical protein MJZ98_05240 [Paludibacteraceae bacterium]|nr:hypothetical protein [Paludibacteraceae bacterium]